ncbi:MAG: T9SS type A sorting domain-containing protein [Candidatus Kariarchaeaceae archaeon]
MDERSDDTDYIIIVGGDEIIPFYRAEDPASPLTEKYQEEDYVLNDDVSHLLDVDNPVANSFKDGKVFTDNFYVDFQNDIPFVPDISISRLVEKPIDMINQIETYLSHNSDLLTIQRSRCGSSISSERSAAKKVHEYMGQLVVDAEFFYSTSWTLQEAEEILNEDISGFLFYTGHGSHIHYTFGDDSRLIPVEVGNIGPSIVIAATCHSAVNMQDDFFTGTVDNSYEDDLVAGFLKAGVAGYLGFTGFGGGTRHFITYTDEILTRFVEYLTNGYSIGNSVRLAKFDYYQDLLIETPKANKSILIVSHFGLPFYRIKEDIGKLFMKPLEKTVEIIDDSKGQTLQNTKSITITLPEYNWQNIAEYKVYSDGNEFNFTESGKPVLPITEIVTDKIPNENLSGIKLVNSTFEYIQLEDPYFILGDIIYFNEINDVNFDEENWYPTNLYTINKQYSKDSLAIKFIVAAAQYLSTKNRVRICKQLEFELYYADESVNDTEGPIISDHSAITDNNFITFLTSVSDNSNIANVTTEISIDNGLSWFHYVMIDTQNSNEFLKTIEIPSVKQIFYNFLARDEWGNSSVVDNLGSSFSLEFQVPVAPEIDLSPYDIFSSKKTVTFYSSVDDNDLDSSTVKFNYSLDNGNSWISDRMIYLENDWIYAFETNILDLTDTLLFYISASDLSGKYSSNPASEPEQNSYKLIYINDPTEIISQDIIVINFQLFPNYPNPFNPITKIKFALPNPETVKIDIFNTLGQRIENLLNQKMPVGYHEVEFNAQQLSSGIYFYRIEAGEFQDVKKMILIR